MFAEFTQPKEKKRKENKRKEGRRMSDPLLCIEREDDEEKDEIDGRDPLHGGSFHCLLEEDSDHGDNEDKVEEDEETKKRRKKEREERRKEKKKERKKEKKQERKAEKEMSLFNPWKCAERGSGEEMNKLLKRSDVDEWINKGDDSNGWTPLHYASIYGHLEVMKFLLSSGADIGCAAKNGNTSLHYASFNGHLEVVKFLLSSEADVNRTDNKGNTPLDYACTIGHLEVVKCLLLSGAFVDAADTRVEPAIAAAFRKGHSSVVEVFIALELKGKLSYQDGGSLLHVVCRGREVERGLMEKLLDKGIDATKRDKHGKLPMDYLSESNKKIEAPLSFGNKPSINDSTKGEESKAEHQSCEVEAKSRLKKEEGSRLQRDKNKQIKHLGEKSQTLKIMKGKTTARLSEEEEEEEDEVKETKERLKKLEEENRMLKLEKEKATERQREAEEKVKWEKEIKERLKKLEVENQRLKFEKGKATGLQLEEKDKVKLEQEVRTRLEQLEEENHRLKAEKRIVEKPKVFRTDECQLPQRDSIGDRGASPSEIESVTQSVLGASSLSNISCGTNVADEAKLPLVHTVHDSAVIGASSLSICRARTIQGIKGSANETAPPPVPPLGTVGASSLSSACGEKEQRDSGVSGDSSLGTRVLEVQDVKLGEIIGQGAFGKVFKGECNFHEVAVKVFECGSSIPEEVAEKVRREVQVMCQLSHPNIVRLYGLVERTDSPPMLVMEFGAGGSLYSYLRRCDFAARPWSHRLRIAFELSRGLAYLHKMNIVHRDIKSLNVIMDVHSRAIWCDFGLAVTKEHVLTSTCGSTSSDGANQNQGREQVAGTLRWLAPEQFTLKHSTPSRASDVWSLGMVFFEIASQKVPYSMSTNKDVIKDWIKAGEVEEVPEECVKKAPVLARIMRKCWSDRIARPSAADIAEELYSITSQSQKPSP